LKKAILILEINKEGKETMKLPFKFDLERPIFEIIFKNKPNIKIYANGKTEGVDEPHGISNRIPILNSRWYAFCQIHLLNNDQQKASSLLYKTSSTSS